jgi:hypothetical protein
MKGHVSVATVIQAKIELSEAVFSVLGCVITALLPHHQFL